MKIKSLILLIVFSLFFISCEKEMRWVNPNDPNADQTEIDKICKQGGYECGYIIAIYKGVSFEMNCGKCKNGYECDESNNICEEIDRTETGNSADSNENSDTEPAGSTEADRDTGADTSEDTDYPQDDTDSSDSGSLDI